MLTSFLYRVIAICVLAALNDLMLPSGNLKKNVRLISGLMLADLALRFVLKLPEALDWIA